MDTSRDIIKRVGGVRAVADGLGYSWKSVHNWTRPGRVIPARVWPAFAALPAAREHNITVDLLAGIGARMEAAG